MKRARIALSDQGRFRKAVHAALWAGVASTTFAVPAVLAQETPPGTNDPTKLETLEVTGSRLKRTDVEGALPITVIDRSQIDLSGEISVAEFLRDMTFNSFGSFRPASGSSAQSFAEISLRGLGGGRTLVLIDGHRAPVAPNVGEGQDLNTIPLAAVERIEILTDGASAIYGADAIGGVVNIITRKDFTGVAMTLGGGNPKRPGGETEEGSVLFGTFSNQGRLLAGISFNNRDIIFSREREWSRGGASTFSNNYLSVVTDPNTGETQPGSFFDLNPDPLIADSRVPGGCSDPAFFEGSSTSATTGITTHRCFYDFTTIAADEAAIDNSSLFTRAEYRISDDWSTYLNGSISRVKSFGRYAPVPEAIFTPASSPNNVTGQDIFIRHRFAAMGPRDTFTDSNVYDFLVGAKATLGLFDLDFGGRRSESKYNEFGYNFLSIPVAERYFADGTYDVFDPDANDPAILADMSLTATRDGEFTTDELFAHTEFGVAQLPAGQVRTSIGFEYRSEDFADLYDQQSAAGNVGGSAGNSSFGGRHVRSAFGEMLVPIVERLEMQLAARYDDYSDFGNATSPKIALRFQALDNLVFRASYGEGFRAPPLVILNQQPAFSADFVRDAQTATAFGLPANAVIQITAFVLANPDLRPEQSDQFSFGTAWQATDWFDMGVDYYNITVEDQIRFFGSNTLLAREGTTLPTPAGLGVFRNPDGSILEILTGYDNEGKIKTWGIDVNLNSNLPLPVGRIRNRLQFGYVGEYEVFGLEGGEDLVHTATPEEAFPEYRAMLSNTFDIAPFEFGLNIHHIASFKGAGDQRIDSYTTGDVQALWNTPWNGSLALGVVNVTDEDPILDDFSARGYHTTLSDPYGRVPYVRVTQRF